jgi:hypothetical protein
VCGLWDTNHASSCSTHSWLKISSFESKDIEQFILSISHLGALVQWVLLYEDSAGYSEDVCQGRTYIRHRCRCKAGLCTISNSLPAARIAIMVQCERIFEDRRSSQVQSHILVTSVFIIANLSLNRGESRSHKFRSWYSYRCSGLPIDSLCTLLRLIHFIQVPLSLDTQPDNF